MEQSKLKMVNLASAKKEGIIFVLPSETPININDVIEYGYQLYKVDDVLYDVFTDSKQYKFFNGFLNFYAPDPKKIYYNDENFRGTFLRSIK